MREEGVTAGVVRCNRRRRGEHIRVIFLHGTKP